MELKAGSKVKHKLTGHDLLVLEVGPKSKEQMVPGQMGPVMKEVPYLSEGIVRVRLPNMSVVDIYDYEINGIEAEDNVYPGTSAKMLLMEKS